MSKISLHINLLNKKENENLSFELLGILRDNIIVYNEDKIKVKLDLENYFLTRENEEYLIKLDFKNNKGIYYLKKYFKNFGLDLKTKKINVKENNIEINYIINMDSENEYIYKIKYEVIK